VPGMANPYSVADVLSVVEDLWPVGGAEEWDAPGLVAGAVGDPVNHVRLMVDVVPDTVDEAIGDGADLIIAHHPLLLKPVHSVAEQRYKGRVLARLIRSRVSLLSAHTNADVVPTGTSRVMAGLLGLENQNVISPGTTFGHGMGIVGELPAAMSLYDVASRLGAILPQTASGIRVSGDPDTPVRKVALCAGAGDSLLGHPAVDSADVYITSDLRHHPASEVAAQRLGGIAPALIDVSHFAAEWLWLAQAQKDLEKQLPGLTVSVSDLVTDPWDFVVHPG
jgi:dinuclear metal center YbgI/SA1388 family protein